jgi:endo-1,3(4)-beta-glucanase
MSEFGSGAYNDHLFHYGYFLYAVSVVLHIGDSDDFDWWERVQDRVLAIARDIANPNSDLDAYFPQFRHKSDWYVGHSWASGLFPSGAYPNIESTAEALNAWYSLYLLGYSLEQNGSNIGSNLMTTAKFLLETDLQSFQFYSHLWVNETQAPSPSNSLIYPSIFSSLGIVGNLWGGNAVFQTFFSYDSCEWIENTDFTYCPQNRSVLTSEQIRYFNVLFILGINALPFTPFTHALLDRTWLAQIYDTPALSFTFPNGPSTGFDPRVITASLPDVYGRCVTSDIQYCDGWIAYAWQIFARLGGEYVDLAWKELMQIAVVAQGSTLTNALHFVASQL